MSNPTTHEIQLAIYDLSRGMARSLSAQFLGVNHSIDIIPHTAILAYGNEYYFGSGIVCDDPRIFRQTRQIFPIEIKSLGQSRISQTEFEVWCRRVTEDGTYSNTSYDLLQRNCNNFSHDAALHGLKLSQGVPHWILGVPEKFLSSPMGQVIRPMLEQMQMTGPGFNSNNATISSTSSASSANRVDTKNNSPMENPWANLETTSSTRIQLLPSKSSQTAQPTQKKISLLLQYNQPLISSDTKMIDICITKLVTNREESKLLLTSLGNELKSSNPSLPEDAVENLVSVLNDVISTNAVFVLMLLRLVVLQPLKKNSAIIENVSKIITKNNTDDQGNIKKSAAVRSMAWCVVSNYIGSNQKETSMSLEKNGIGLQNLVDAALLDLVPENRVEIRQSASAFLYNLVVMKSYFEEGKDYELPDIVVTLLCGVLEGLNNETDLTTKIRRTLVMGKIICPSTGHGSKLIVNPSARNLINDLGFTDMLVAMSQEDKALSEDKNKVLGGDKNKLLLLFEEMLLLLSGVVS